MVSHDVLPIEFVVVPFFTLNVIPDAVSMVIVTPTANLQIMNTMM